jgi:hypothetical protein
MKVFTDYLWFDTKKRHAEFDGRRKKRVVVKVMGA